MVTRIEVLKKSETKCFETKESVREILSKVFRVASKIWKKESIREKHLQVENLRARIQSSFFKDSGMIDKGDLSRIASFLFIDENFLAQAVEWEGILTTCTNDVDIIDFQISNLPSVTMEEVRLIVSRYIESAKGEIGHSPQ